QRLAETLDERFSRGLRGTKLLILGIAYKKNVDDMRESPALEIMEIVRERGAEVFYHDPFILEIEKTREHMEFAGMKSIEFTSEELKRFDAVIICTDHDNVDYDFIVENCHLVVDTRNATKEVKHHRD